MGVNLRRFLHLPQNLATQIVHAPQYVVGIEKPVSRLSCKCEQRNPIPGKTVQVRNDLHLVQPVGGKLTGNLESADRIHLFPEKVQPVRFALGKGKHVEDTATQRILSGFVNEIHLREPRIGQQLLQLSDLHPHGFAPHRVGVGHPFGQSFRIGTDNPVFARSHFPTQSTQRRRPLHDTLRILRTVNDRTLVGARKKVNLFFVEQGIKIVEQVGRRIAVFRHEDVRTARSGDQGSGINRESPADHIAQKNGPPRRIVRTTREAPLRRSTARYSVYFRDPYSAQLKDALQESIPQGAQTIIQLRVFVSAADRTCDRTCMSFHLPPLSGSGLRPPSGQ